MAPPDYIYSTTHNTRNYNRALTREERPPNYANEAGPPRKPKRPHSPPGQRASSSRRVREQEKRPRRTLNLLHEHESSPAELARDARRKTGLAVPVTFGKSSPAASGEAAEIEHESPSLEPLSGAPSLDPATLGAGSQAVVDNSDVSRSRLSNAMSPVTVADDASIRVNPDTIATWNGMPEPPSYNTGEGATAAGASPPLRSSQGKVSDLLSFFVGQDVPDVPQTATDYLHAFNDMNLARTRTHAILRRSRPPPDTCRRCRRLLRGSHFPPWRCYDCTYDRDLCKRCTRETHHSSPYHRMGWWNGHFHQQAWLRDAGVSIFLCEDADPIAGRYCPSSPHLAQLPPGFDEHDPDGYRHETTISGNLYEEELDRDTSTTAYDEVATDGGDIVEDDLLHKFATLPLDDGEVEATTEQVADEGDEQQTSQANPTSDAARGMGTFPLRDARGLKVMVVGDVEHMHGLGVQFCSCRGARPRDEQLLEYGIYPASADRPATGFTLHTLDYLRIDELECKTTPEAYCKKVRRLTSPRDWRMVPVSH